MTDEPDPLKAAMSQYFRRLGAKGGKIGGKKRWQNLTSAKRKAMIRKMVEARGKKKIDINCSVS